MGNISNTGGVTYITGHTGLLTGTRDAAAATADVSYTGLDFTPDFVIMYGQMDGGNYRVSIGASDGTDEFCIYQGGSTVLWYSFAGLGVLSSQNGYNQKPAVKSFDEGGLTITWTRTANVPASADMNFGFILIGSL
jgi:hypothetical protein